MKFEQVHLPKNEKYIVPETSQDTVALVTSGSVMESTVHGCGDFIRNQLITHACHAGIFLPRMQQDLPDYNLITSRQNDTTIHLMPANEHPEQTLKILKERFARIRAREGVQKNFAYLTSKKAKDEMSPGEIYQKKLSLLQSLEWSYMRLVESGMGSAISRLLLEEHASLLGFDVAVFSRRMTDIKNNPNDIFSIYGREARF